MTENLLCDYAMLRVRLDWFHATARAAVAIKKLKKTLLLEWMDLTAYAACTGALAKQCDWNEWQIRRLLTDLGGLGAAW